MPRLQRAKTCIQAIEKGLEFLIALQGEGGAMDADTSTLRALHRLPMLLTSAGRIEEGQRLLTWMGENLLKEDGALGGANADAAWVASGAQMAGRYDISEPVVTRLAAFQGENVGGVYEAREGGRSRTHHLVTTASALLAFLTCGRLAEARRAGLFLVRVLRAQKRGNTFCARFDHTGKPAEETEPDSPDPLGGLPHALDKADPNQRFDILGLPQMALARLHLANGEEEFLSAAKGYAHIGHRVDQHLWLDVTGWANAWGEATLYRITRRRRYLRYAERLVGYLIDHQQGNGSWLLAREHETLDQQPMEVTVDTTATALQTLIECLREVQ